MDPSGELASPTAMKELIQYFETHGRMLDRQEAADLSASQSAQQSSDFISLIRFNGVPILPPVMTGSRVEEVRQDRHSAAFKEKRLRARQHKHLMAKAKALVESTEVGLPSDSKAGKSATARLPLDRPLVLKPVVTTAWGSVLASGGTTASSRSFDSASAIGPSSVANTFATAEQGEQEEFGLQTLDSVCSDLMSLEETLPTDFNGVPLTSVKQQKISHDLLRLSKVLKVRDFNSTGGSDISDLPSEYSGQPGSEKGKSSNTAVLDNVSSSFCHDSQDTVVEATTDNVTLTENNVTENTSGFMDNSTDGSPAELSSQGEGNLSGAGSANTSGMSSANTTSTTDSHRSSRSSPRSFKNNTVHFASFVTEYIDTSASLSSENITVVKKKLPGDKIARDKSEAKVTSGSAVGVQGTKENSEGLLANVSLTLANVSFTEPDSPGCLTPVSPPPNLPFQSYAKVDPSSSDKENDAEQANKPSGGREGLSGSSESRLDPKSGSGGVSDSQGSSKSDATVTTSESSNSTLIEEAAPATASQDSTTTLPQNIIEPPAGTKDQRDSPKDSSATVTRKPKKLPPEPPQESYQQHSARQGKPSADKDSNNRKKESSDSAGHKGHVRRGSYTLLSPSLALLQAQVMSEKDVVEDRIARSEDEEDHTKPLNIPPQSSVPSEHEAAGKAEHINKYLSQVQLHNSEDLTASQLSADLSQYDPATSTHMQSSVSILQSLATSHRSLSSASGSSGVPLEEFQSLRQNLLEQQQKELEELFIQQRREQMLLQAEIEEHQHRMKEQQEFLASNAPENLKVPSQEHDGELSLASNTSLKQFNFPAPKHSSVNLHSQGGVANLSSHGPLLLNNSSSSSSPKVRRPVLRSPVKFHPGRMHTSRVIVPPEAYEPEMKVKFDKITAAAKGFLCRRLLYSDKVQDLVKTIKDTREFAFSFQSETPIRKGNFSNQDRTLLERIVAQLQAALLDVHEIFFDTPVAEQMSLIEQTRLNNRERRLKTSTDETVRSSAPRISTATLKAQERRRRAQEAESAVFGASMARPRTAPSSTSPRSHTSVDLSGPLKRHYQFLLSKAMKPAAMQAAHHHHTSRPDSSRSELERPQTAPERSTSARVRKTTGSSQASASSHVTDSGQTKINIRPKQPQQPTSQPASSKSTKTSKSSKSWR